ncbi:MAG: alpha/beta fold hydrolase [Acidobacteriota bacterium]
MHSAVQGSNPWLSTTRPNPDARVRLFCLPYAGGGATAYRTWHAHLPADVEVCAVQLPGRENRFPEPPFTNLLELARALPGHLLPSLDRPFALFGHSMGAQIAYELARQLVRQYGRTPTHVFVSGSGAPDLPRRDAYIHTLPRDEAFLAELHRRYNQIPAIMFEDAELRELYVRLLRADLMLAETYRCADPVPLPCPIVALGGEQDRGAPPEDLRAWQTLTDAAFSVHLFRGGHFYFSERVQPLLATISHYLA